MKSSIFPLYEYLFAFSRSITFGFAFVFDSGFTNVSFLSVVLSLVFVCVFRLVALLYDFSFTKTVDSDSSISVSGVVSRAVSVVVAVVAVTAFWYSLLISTWISLGALVSIMYFREIVSKYLYGMLPVRA